VKVEPGESRHDEARHDELKSSQRAPAGTERQPDAARKPGEKAENRDPLYPRLGVLDEQQLHDETDNAEENDREDKLTQRPRTEPPDGV